MEETVVGALGISLLRKSGDLVILAALELSNKGPCGWARMESNHPLLH